MWLLHGLDSPLSPSVFPWASASFPLVADGIFRRQWHQTYGCGEHEDCDSERACRCESTDSADLPAKDTVLLQWPAHSWPLAEFWAGLPGHDSVRKQLELNQCNANREGLTTLDKSNMHMWQHLQQPRSTIQSCRLGA